MKHAFIADIHGNLDALDAVLAEIDSLGIQSITCVGDIVGYGALPAECIQTIRSRQISCVAGNHDLAVAGATSIEFFNELAKDSVLWTRSQLSEDEIDFLVKRPFEIHGDGFQVSHGAPGVPARFDYILSYEDAVLAFEAMEEELLFTAHSHVPLAFVMKGRGLTGNVMGSMVIDAGARAIVNVGSVGQPRDGNALAAFAVFDTDEREVAVARVKYDVEEAARRILEAGLPPGNAYRLVVGR